MQESKSSLNLKLEEFHGNPTYYLKNHNDISNIQKRLTAYTELEDKLFNRRIVKLMKVCSTVSLKTIRTKMNLEQKFSRDLQNILLSHQISHNYINTRRFKQKSQNNSESLTTSSLIVETNKEQTKIENGLSDETTSERTNDLLDLANILVDLAGDDIPPAQNINSQELRSQGETSGIGNHAEMDMETNRLNGKFVSDNAFNLSRRNISDSELNLLSKGLSFVPTPERIDRYQLKNDLERFGRNIRLKMFYANESTLSFSNSRAFRIPSKWTLLIRDTQLELYLSEIEHETMKIEERGSNYPNLTKEEREAIESLVKDDSIIIKLADKGSGIVIWDKEDYLRECLNHLDNKIVYEKLEKDPLKTTNKKIHSTLSNMLRKKEIDKRLFEYLYIKRPQLVRFYLLPKIHKRTKNVPGRPIISNKGTATENISLP